tara:strand:+ start:868 stop:1536 length:669 start_codon:yes stop_codon:yes gene_type:complete
MKPETINFKLKTIWDVENIFYQKSNPTRINKIICHYEIFKKTLKVPGAIIECGVFKGSSLIRFITFRDLIMKKLKKKVYGFDVFGTFPRQKIKKDNKFAIKHDKEIGKGIAVNQLNSELKKKKIKNFMLIKGDIKKTIPTFLKNKSNFKISFLHVDLDVFEATKFVLEKLYKNVSRGGIILIDDYGQVDGATKATNYFLKNVKNIKIQTLNFDKRLKFIIKK